MIKGINFQPWISANYFNGSGKYNKLLILGESHYNEEDDCEEQKDYEENNQIEEVKYIENKFTSAVIQDFLDDKNNIAFYRNLGLLFNPEDKKEIWREVAFANAIQNPLKNADSQPTSQDIETAKTSFWLLLQDLNPDKILVCSKRMWNNWIPEDANKSKFVRHISNNKKKSTIWEYDNNGKQCLAMGINHPSKYFSYINWRPIVMEFLNEIPKELK